MKKILSIILTAAMIISMCAMVTGCAVIDELLNRVSPDVAERDPDDSPTEADEDEDEDETESADKTTAVIVGDHKVTAVELNYFYIEDLKVFYNTYGPYASLFGLDVTKPLDEQTYDSTGITWADYFLDNAMEKIKAVYAICDEAKANGFALSENDKTHIDSQMEYLSLYATYYGYSDLDDYLVATYGPDASKKTIRAYYELVYLAEAYQKHFQNSLTYTDTEIAAWDMENPAEYSSYSYHSYYISTSRYLPSDDAVRLAEEDAKSLTAGDITSVEDLDAAIAALDINAGDDSAVSSPYMDCRYTVIDSSIRGWICDESRQPGDMDCIANVTIDEEGNETVNGYHVLYFVGKNTNEFPLANVRHILAMFEGGSTNEFGYTVYSDDEKAAAKAAADDLLAQWKAGEATEDSFAAMANEHSDDGDGTTGGLYTDIYPGQMVTAFENWCFADGRQAGDTGVIETEYGYHVMYYVGNSESSYREYLITQDLISRDINDWYTDLVNSISLTVKETKYVPTDMPISAN